MSPWIDGHAMIAKPITTEKKRSDVFVPMHLKRAACIAVVTPPTHEILSTLPCRHPSPPRDRNNESERPASFEV